jgi:hypothetical protein
VATLGINHVLAVEFAPDPGAAGAMRRVHRGIATARDARIVDNGRRQAIARLADRGPDTLRPYWGGLLAAIETPEPTTATTWPRSIIPHKSLSNV